MKTTLISHICKLGILSLCLGMASCNDWLDVQSKVDIKETDVFADESGFWDSLAGVYSSMGSTSLYGSALTMSTLDILAGYYDIQYGQVTEGVYNLSRYNYLSTLSRPTFDAIWEGMYNAIANDNNVLKHLEVADKDIFEEGHYDLIKGEALALRAYLHFDLLRMFGKAYWMDPDAVAIPYVKRFGKDATPRSTVSEVIELALDDCRAAVECLKNDPVQDSSFETDNIYLLYRTNRLNLYAVQALMARIYLYRGTEADRAEALKLADYLIDDVGTFDLVMSSYMSTNRILSGETLFTLYKDDLSEVYESNFLYSYDSYGNLIWTGKLATRRADINEMFNTAQWGESKDGRLAKLMVNAGGYYFSTKYEQRDGDVQPAKCRIPLIRLAEMYYISAECTDDLDKATDRLADIWRARGYGLPDLGIETKEDVLQFIADDYRRDFYAEGQLFYFYKRNGYTSIPGSTVDISGKLESVYVFPIPEDEDDFGIQ